MNRKLKKLLRDPKLFFKDMYLKKEAQLKRSLPIKHDGHNQYTVVSAVYNVEKYLDDYFSSLVSQTLNFKNHIYLILVDDGSTDSSAQIIKKWQKKYPNNIQYIHKTNGGISSARNLGLTHVKTKWVTFIDSDDFIHPDYFKIVDDTISKDESIKLAVGNLKFYFDENKLVQDTHSLRYRFNKEVNIVPIKDLNKNINLFVTVSFFETSILRKNNIKFDENIKPNFEDGKFLADYFLHTETGSVAYLQKAIFFYRKRGDGSSTIDNSWQKKEKYYNILAFGYLPMLKAYKEKYGTIPKNIQWTVLYELSWHIKTLLNQDYKIDFLSSAEQETYYQLALEVFSYIDDNQILDFDLIGIWFFYKIGMMGLKRKKPAFNIAYIENIDKNKQQILVVYPTYYDISVSYRIDNKDIIPKFQKVVDYTFANQIFVQEFRAWIPYQSLNEQLGIMLDGKHARLSLFGKQKNNWKIQEIADAFSPSEKYRTDGSWIIMDRDTQADDNGEHFYRYMKENHPEQTCYFALNKNSHDWVRLQKEGFLLLDFGSKQFENHLRKASKIISSHFDGYITNYFGDEYEYSKKYVFLQHGVIQNNLSRWLNYKRNMLGIITTTPEEYNSIALDHNNYHVGKKEVFLCGLARHDALLKNNKKDSKIILIMPTWRSSIIGKASKTGNFREYNKNFMQTEYARHWSMLVKSAQLKILAEQYGYKIIFAPHANIEPYLPLFEIPQYIQTWEAENSKMSIQQLFQTAQVMITDYSSVAFEMGFLEKSVIYYQFDKDEVFSGGHITQKGYFSYENHGFGPVVENENDLIDSLGQVLQNDGHPCEPYLSRIKATFPYRDRKNCERTYLAIQNMDKLDNSLDINLLKTFAENALQQSAWHLLEERSYQLQKIQAEEKYEHYYLLSLFKQNKFVYLYKCLQASKANIAYWHAKMGFHLNDETNSLEYFKRNPPKELDDKLLCLIYSAYNQDITFYQEIRKIITTNSKTILAQVFLKLSEFVILKNWKGFHLYLEEFLHTCTLEQKESYKLELFASYIFVKQKNFERANHYISRYYKHSKHDCAYFLAAANMAFAQNNHPRVVSELAQGVKENYSILSQTLLLKYSKSLRELADTFDR
ncbi:MAG: CDP-glycerol glycerophosphotransferase family protein [Neisseria sp.]|uniref:CDP-glycerol glycerophosphotransferase family protein n=1 Tax=Neisseria sp. TaxID=192066 RepID=UPI0026DDB48B|nr:CDP-glycerol glycerophosphotransferase family protein [Neisseria sp.]MDO4640275.1 CDP-glycerol glycerophosphotransferase family protein [Neisseria sp.]